MRGEIFGNRYGQGGGRMKVSLKTLMKKYGQNRHTGLLALIFIVGIGLLLLPSGKQEPQKEPATDSAHAYRERVEKQLSDMLSSVKNVGKAQVMITFQDEGQTFFAEDEEETRDGEKRDFSAAHVLKNDGSGTESPLVEKKTVPEVAGVLVVAPGAENPQVKAEIVSAVRAVLGVKSHRIEVLEKK